MPSIRIKEIELWYEEWGTGLPLIFLHAFAAEGSMWQPQVDVFAKAAYRVICIDLRGHGRSSEPTSPYTIPQMAADVHMLAGQLDLGQVCLAGLSMGGRVAMQFALAYPSDLHALILVSTKSEPAKEAEPELERLMDLARREGAYQAVSQWYQRPNYIKLGQAAPKLARQMLDGWREKSAEGFIGAARAILDMAPMSSHLAEITAPTLAVAGEQDDPCHAYAERYRRSIPECVVAYVPEAAHFVNVERPETFNPLLLEFMQTVREQTKAGRIPTD